MSPSLRNVNWTNTKEKKSQLVGSIQIIKDFFTNNFSAVVREVCFHSFYFKQIIISK